MSKEIFIKVCMGTGGVAAGGTEVLLAFEEELKKKEVKASVEKHCTMHKVGCRGLCARDVLVDVLVGGEKSTYQLIKADMVPRIVEEHLVGGKQVEEWLVGDGYHAFQGNQVKVVLTNCGEIDPEDIEAYIAVKGYEATAKAITKLGQEKTIDIIKKSGLRGRGGAGFSAGTKWEICSKNESDDKYIICNAGEGHPVIEGNPHSIIEGMIIGAFAIGASVGYVYIRAEYPIAVERFQKALDQATKKGLLGKNILGSGFDFDIEIKLGAGAFVCGEETALLASIEGERGMPRAKPPFPVHNGLWGKPTVINNVETLSNVPYIIRKGSDWFSAIGTEKSKGTKVFALTGKVVNSGFIEVPMGTSLKTIVYDIGGGIQDGKKLKAVQTGGPSGGCIPASMVDINVDYESLASVGAIVGTGGMIVLSEEDCMINFAKYFVEFMHRESCGKCVPCRIGTKRLHEIMERITSGKGRNGDIELLEKLSSHVIASSLCGLGQTAPNPILGVIRYFREELEAHIEGRCPAKGCRTMLTYTILEESCKGCGACLRACATGAITGEKKKPHHLDQSLCIKCGACFDTCKFGAVGRE